jgi:hypothetical protein
VAVPAPHPWRTKGERLNEVARRALFALVSMPQILLGSCVGGAGVDENPSGLIRNNTPAFLPSFFLARFFLLVFLFAF